MPRSTRTARTAATSGCTIGRPQIERRMTEPRPGKPATSQVGNFPLLGTQGDRARQPRASSRRVEARTGAARPHMIGAEVTELIQGYVVGKTLETARVELIHDVFRTHAERDERESTLAPMAG